MFAGRSAAFRTRFHASLTLKDILKDPRKAFMTWITSTIGSSMSFITSVAAVSWLPASDCPACSDIVPYISRFIRVSSVQLNGLFARIRCCEFCCSSTFNLYYYLTSLIQY